VDIDIEFRVCRWLDETEFRDLLKFADYKGRVGRCSLFKFSPVKYRRNKLWREDVLELLERVGAELDEDSRAKLEAFFEEEQTVYIYAAKGLGYIIRSQAYLADMLQEFREKGDVYYSKEHKGFIVKPYAIIDVIKKLKLGGLKIVDKSNLIDKRNAISVELKITLRDYQEEAVEAWITHDGRGVIALPTGAGKTYVGIAAIARLKLPTLIVVYTKEQLYQWLEKLLEATNLTRSSIGLYYSEEKRIAPITITTYQTAYRHAEILSDKFSLLIVDEVHHLPADKFRLIALKLLAPYRMGLSATPYREDGRHEELFKLMGGIVYFKMLQELQDKGYIAPYRIIPVFVTLKPSEAVEYQKLRREYQELAGGRSVEELLRDSAAGDETAKKALSILNSMKKLVAHSEAKIEAAKRIVEEELAKGSKIIVFTQYLTQAEIAARKLGAPLLSGSTPRERRRLILEGFKKGYYKVIVMTTVGDEGIDIPDADVGIILSGSGSRRQFIQRLGRLLRPKPGKEAKLYEIIAKNTFEERHYRRLINADILL